MKLNAKWFEQDVRYGGKICIDRDEVFTLDDAFNKSIEKYELITMGYDIPINSKVTCGLCNLYHKNECVGCPIYQETGERYCNMFSEFNHLFMISTEMNEFYLAAIDVANKLREWKEKYVPKEENTCDVAKPGREEECKTCVWEVKTACTLIRDNETPLAYCPMFK